MFFTYISWFALYSLHINANPCVVFCFNQNFPTINGGILAIFALIGFKKSNEIQNICSRGELVSIELDKQSDIAGFIFLPLCPARLSLPPGCSFHLLSCKLRPSSLCAGSDYLIAASPSLSLSCPSAGF